MERSKWMWVYCDKLTGEPLFSGRNGTIHLMPSKPTKNQCDGYGSVRGVVCVPRKIRFVFEDQFIEPKNLEN